MEKIIIKSVTKYTHTNKLLLLLLYFSFKIYSWNLQEPCLLMRYWEIRIIRWTITPSILVNTNKIKVLKVVFGCERREELATYI